MESAGRRPLLISKGWVQVVILVMLSGFFVLGLLAYRTYMEKPPIPQRTVDEQAGCCTRPSTSRRARRCSCTTG
jgi:nitric oxide reductase subunit B